MKNLIPFTLTIILLSNCTSPKQRTVQLTPKKKPSLVIGNPLNCGIDSFLIFPVGSDYSPEIVNKPEGNTATVYANGTAVMCFATNCSTFYDGCARTEYVNNNENEFDIRNILFYNQFNGKTYQLISDTMHILSFAIHKEFSNPMILYRVVKKDVTGDSIFNQHDAVMLYVSDLHGKHLTQITPDEEQFSEYYYYANTQTILAKTFINANNDSAFTVEDETNYREMKIKSPELGREIFSKSLKDSLRSQGATL